MAHIEIDETTGQRFYIDDEGNEYPADNPGLLAQAGRQVADMGSGLQMAWGNVTGNDALVQQAEQETAARNAIFAGADQAYPWQSMIGQALPGMAAGAYSGLWGGLGLGAAEGALDVSEGGNAWQRAGAGALGAAAGEVLGRVLGRAFNLVEGISQATAGRTLTANPQAAAFERLGGETMAYQRMTPDTLGQSFAEAATKGARVSMFGAAPVKRAFRANDALFNEAAAEAVGAPLGPSGILDTAWRKSALDRFDLGFAEVAGIAQQKGQMKVRGALLRSLNNNRVINRLRDEFGMFKGLNRKHDQFLTGREWFEARKVLADQAALEENAALAGRYYGLIDELDTWMARQPGMGKEFTELFAGLRDQYRVFRQLEKPNVINTEGNINIKPLNRVLRSEDGYGRTATAGTRKTANEATQRLIDLAEAGDKPGFAAFKSSGTAENQQLRETMQDVSGAITEGAGGLVRGVLNQAAPMVTPLMELGGGLPYDYLLNRPAMRAGVGIGQGVGRGALDEMFYPLVGVQDERPR